MERIQLVTFKGSEATSYFEALCVCEQRLHLTDPLDNECPSCGRWFNILGQQVTPSHGCDAAGNPLGQDIEETHESADMFEVGIQSTELLEHINP